MTEEFGIGLIAIGSVILITVFFVWAARQPKRESPLKMAKPPSLASTDDPAQSSVFDELERFEQAEKARARADEKRRKRLRPFGVFGRLATYAALFVLLYAYWPRDISHTPFASLTLSDVFGTVAAVVVGIVLLRALFEPSDDEGIKEAWGCLGVLIACLAGFAVLFFSTQR